MSIIWLRTAAALYSVGLIYALSYLFRKGARLFLPALLTFGVGTVFHLVALVELSVEAHRLPLNNSYETSSLCAFLIAIFFLAALAYYRVAVLSVCLFPIVFCMTLVGATEIPIAPWSSPQVRDAWLLVHIVSVLIGYAALILSAAAAIFYLLQERRLKRKQLPDGRTGLPPLALLDALITQAMNAGFLFTTVGVVTGVIWAFIESGTRWILDPRIALFLFTWAFYLAMIFLRVSAGWRGRRIAWLAVSVLGCSLLTWASHVGFRSFLF